MKQAGAELCQAQQYNYGPEILAPAEVGLLAALTFDLASLDLKKGEEWKDGMQLEKLVR